MIGDSAQAILDRRAAQARENRLAMPFTAARLDEARKTFGDGVGIRYVNENGIERDKRVTGNVVLARDMALEAKKAE